MNDKKPIDDSSQVFFPCKWLYLGVLVSKLSVNGLEISSLATGILAEQSGAGNSKGYMEYEANMFMWSDKNQVL